MIASNDKVSVSPLTRRVNKLLELHPENDKVGLEHNLFLSRMFLYFKKYFKMSKY